MKAILILIAAIFLMGTVNHAEGRKPVFGKKEKVCSRTVYPNSVMSTGNGTAIILEGPIMKSADEEDLSDRGKSRDPTIIRKRIRCICGLPICKCSGPENPEQWFVKTFLRDDEKLKPARYYLSHYNGSEEVENCPDVSSLSSSIFQKFLKKRNGEGDGIFSGRYQRRNKWLFGCPPLLNLRKDARNFDDCSLEKFNFVCECLQCQFQSENEKSGILLKCTRCGPIRMNATSEPTNYSNLILRRNNRLKLKIKFLQVN